MRVKLSRDWRVSGPPVGLDVGWSEHSVCALPRSGRGSVRHVLNTHSWHFVRSWCYGFVLVTFCGCGKTSGPRQLIKGRVFLGSQFQKVRVHGGRVKTGWRVTDEQLGAHIFLFMYVCMHLFIVIFVRLFFVCMHLNAVASGGQRHEIPLKLELKVLVSHQNGYREPNLGPLEKREVLVSTEPLLQQQRAHILIHKTGSREHTEYVTSLLKPQSLLPGTHLHQQGHISNWSTNWEPAI